MPPQSPSDSGTEKLYTIGTVSKLTGVGAITLRAWERRYELIHPVRKESGHRLYTRTHIDQINRINALTDQGMRISQISLDMLESSPADSGLDAALASLWGAHLESMISAIIAFDEARLEEIYNEVLSLYPIELATRMLLKPLLIELGLRWETAAGSVAEEHFFAFYLRNKLGARFHHRSRSETGPRLLLAGLPGEYHEIALLLFALSANEQGFRLLPLGANTTPLFFLAPLNLPLELLRAICRPLWGRWKSRYLSAGPHRFSLVTRSTRPAPKHWARIWSTVCGD